MCKIYTIYSPHADVQFSLLLKASIIKSSLNTSKYMKHIVTLLFRNMYQAHLQSSFFSDKCIQYYKTQLKSFYLMLKIH